MLEKIKLSHLTILAISIMLCSCTIADLPKVSEAKNTAKSINYEIIAPFKNITITQGKTTKQEVIDILGTPSSIESEESETFLTYSLYHENFGIRLKYIEKDGTTYNYLIQRNQKSENVSIEANLKGIVKSVDVF